jgi:hypothetical protein
MDEAVAAMIDEESRLRMMGSGNPMKRAYVVIEDRECYNCGEKEHLSYDCPKPRGGSGGQGGSCGGCGSTRGGYGGGRGSRGGSEVVTEVEVMMDLKPI